MEEFKNATEDYEVSNFGNIRKKLKNGNYKLIGGSILNRGYKYFQLQRDGKRINYLIHHLVANLFIGERPENQVIDHIDRNKLNNNVSNLRYTTQKENMKNKDNYINDIEETDPKKRHYLRCKRYNELNKEQIKKLKHEYYLASKN